MIPRTEGQAAAVRARAEPSLIVPERAVDAQSLIAYADVVVSAGGTMNREAVALGTPVYTIFSGRMGAVDERLIADGLLRPLSTRQPGSSSSSASPRPGRASRATRTSSSRRSSRRSQGGELMFVDGRPETIQALFAFVIAAVLAWLLVPVAERIARRIGAIDYPNERSLHTEPTPKLGGLAIFVGTASPRSSSCRGPSRPRRCWSARW